LYFQFRAKNKKSGFHFPAQIVSHTSGAIANQANVLLHNQARLFIALNDVQVALHQRNQTWALHRLNNQGQKVWMKI
jgi:hypothetical protein